MRRPGSILLVSCYELGHQPFAVASPAAFLERAGYSPNVLDLSVTGFDGEKIAEAIFVGISVPMHTALRLGVRTAEYIRKLNPSCHICFYGIYASLNSEYLLEQFADSVIGGEFEEPLMKLIDALSDKNSRDVFLEIEGVSFPERTQPPYLARLKFAPLNYRGLPPLSKYAHMVSNGSHRLAGYIEASRGCLHRCLHCPIPPVYNGRFFVVPETVILDGIRKLVAAGASHITFGDPDFLNGPGHSLRIVRSMHDEFPNLTFDFTAKVEHLLKHRALLSQFLEAGCLFVVSAFESVNDAVLKSLAKGHSRADICKLLEVFRENGITIRPTWIPFTPWTTTANYVDLLEFVRDEQLIQNIDPVQYTVRLLVPPGSLLLHREEMKLFVTGLDQPNFSYRWDHPDSRMDQLQKNVSKLVEQMIHAKSSAVTIFERVRQLAYAVRGDRATPFVRDLVPQIEPPRLTEAWFC